MTTKQAAQILQDFNKWRRGESPYGDQTPPTHCETSPVDIGIAIDIAVRALDKTK